jgi:hypothetical protein
MKLEKDKIRCDCGEWAKPHKFHIEGFIVRGWKCPKCEEEYFSGDIEKVLLLNKLKKHPLAVKVGKLGESKIIRIPKEIGIAVGLKVGKEVLIYPEDQKSIKIK